ncbi:MAG: thiamine-phosphate synthase family protein [Promethearchaeota archaeon]
MKKYEILINQIREIYDIFCSDKKFAQLIPEVRTNISGSLQNARKLEDVAGIEGRITIIDGYPKACGEIKFGVSNHTARLVLTAKKFDNSINFVMNLKYLPALIEKLQNSSHLELIEFNREAQPEEIDKKENLTMQWLIQQSIKTSGKISDIIWDSGGMGKEPMMRVFAKDSNDMIQKLKEIVKWL